MSNFQAPLTVQTSRSILKATGPSEAHSGELVRYNSMDEPNFEFQRSDAGTTTSDYNLNDVIDGFETIPLSQGDRRTANTSRVVDRDRCPGEEIRCHLETVFQ